MTMILALLLSTSVEAGQRYATCLEAEVRRYAPLDQPAETVIDASFTGCSRLGREFRQTATAAPADREMAEAAVDGWEAGQRRRLNRLLLEERLRLDRR